MGREEKGNEIGEGRSQGGDSDLHKMFDVFNPQRLEIRYFACLRNFIKIILMATCSLKMTRRHIKLKVKVSHFDLISTLNIW